MMVRESRMSFVSHLRELRNRIFTVAAFFIIVSCISYMYVDQIFTYLIEVSPGYSFIYTDPAELFMQYFKLSLMIGLIASVPLIAYEIWAFVCPGLKQNEKNALTIALVAGFLFFIIGAVFAYVVIIPTMLEFFVNVSVSGNVKPAITVQNYISFLLSLMITFGIIFEIPVITSMLTYLGLIKSVYLVKGRRYCIFAIFLISAIVTPTTDIINLLMMSVPMMILFEISIVLCKGIERHLNKKRRREVNERQ